MAKRPKQDELGGMKGPGVATAIHKDINRLADKLEELLDQRSETSEEITKVRGNLIDKMKEEELSKYRYRDHLVEYKPGKDKVTIKTIRGDVTSQDGDGTGEEPPVE